MPASDSIPEYRPIPNFPGYKAGTDGTIWTCRERGGPRQWRLGTRWTPLKPSITNKGYYRVTMSHMGGRGLYAVHRLILETFVGPCPEGMVARHLNSVRTDNRLVNLQWSTQSENLSDRLKAGTLIVGERNGLAKLSEAQVQEIRRLAVEGVNGAQLARRFGVHRNCIYSILGRTRRPTWTHTEGGGPSVGPGRPVGEGHRNSKLTAESVREIRRLAAAGISQYSLATTFGISQSVVSGIVTRRRWTHVQ